MRECGAAGSASGQTACPIRPTLCQSRSRQGHVSPLHPGCPSLPLLPVWMYVSFLSTWCRTSLPFDFLSVLVVRGGAVCLPMPPSWFFKSNLDFLRKKLSWPHHWCSVPKTNRIHEKRGSRTTRTSAAFCPSSDHLTNPPKEGTHPKVR